jgi:hypothetical protein
MAKTVVIEPGADHAPDHSKAGCSRAWGWKVMCLTGVDYFSTLGYQPGIASVAAGALSPLATLVLVILTLFGALPIYRAGRQSKSAWRRLNCDAWAPTPWWKGKLFVLTLLGFASTDFMITITLSAADASAHLIQNPFVPRFFQGQAVPITLFLVALLGAVFLKGFKEAIGIAVALVGAYLALRVRHEFSSLPQHEWSVILVFCGPHGPNWCCKMNGARSKSHLTGIFDILVERQNG